MSTPQGAAWTPPPPAEVKSTPPLISFLTKDVQPPSPLYIQRDDAILIRSTAAAASLTAVVRARMLEPNGHIKETEVQIVTSPTIGLSVNTLITLEEGFLLSITAIPTGILTIPGLFNISAFVVRGQNSLQEVVQTLFAGYLSAEVCVGWPSTPPRHPQEGPGQPINNTVGNPAAGSDWSLAMANGIAMRLMCGFFRLVTSAAAGNRTVDIIVTDGVNTIVRIPSNLLIPASTTQLYSIAPGAQLFNVAGQPVVLPFPTGLRFPPIWTIGTLTTGILAGDQFSQIAMGIERNVFGNI